MSGMTRSDLSFVETYDCLTMTELMSCETTGLTPPGLNADAIQRGRR